MAVEFLVEVALSVVVEFPVAVALTGVEFLVEAGLSVAVESRVVVAVLPEAEVAVVPAQVVVAGARRAISDSVNRSLSFKEMR